MEPVDTADDVLRRLTAIPGGPLRDHAASRMLAQLPAELAAEVLERAVDAMRSGRADAGAAAAVVHALKLPELDDAQRSALCAAARRLELNAAALFLALPPQKEAPPPEAGVEAELSLGHRCTLARTAPPERFSQLGADKDARVAGELLLNPRLTEAEVLRLASRRPALPEVLTTIAESARFGGRLRVRTAIARNPYTPTQLAVRLLPHLGRTLLKEIAGDATLHPEVRAFARKLSEAGG